MRLVLQLAILSLIQLKCFINDTDKQIKQTTIPKFADDTRLEWAASMLKEIIIQKGSGKLENGQKKLGA